MQFISTCFFLPVSLLLLLVAARPIKATATLSSEASGKTSSAVLRGGRRLQEEILPEDLQPQVDYVGNNGDFSVPYPLGECQGDCDEDADCSDNLKCYQRGTNDAVPGCQGGVEDDSDSDYCYRVETEVPETVAPTSPPTIYPSFGPTGIPVIEIVAPVDDLDDTSDNFTVFADNFTVDGENFTVMSSFSVLKACQGVCNSDNDCATGLMCYRRNLGEDVPYCQFDDITIKQSPLLLDFCTLPPTPSPTVAPSTAPTAEPTSPAPTREPTPEPTNSPTPCGEAPPGGSTVATYQEFFAPRSLPLCAGDCDSTSDCENGLFCYSRSSGDEVDGCYFGEEICGNRMDVSTGHDICVPRSVLGDLIQFRLKWEPGYDWQGEPEEQWWCMTASDGSLFMQICEFGTTSQLFELIPVNGGATLIKSVEEDDCLEADNPILFSSCDENDGRQRWITQNGDWDSYSFEITRSNRPGWCLTNHHHPKDDESIEMRDCDQERSYNAVAWELWW